MEENLHTGEISQSNDSRPRMVADHGTDFSVNFLVGVEVTTTNIQQPAGVFFRIGMQGGQVQWFSPSDAFFCQPD